MRITSDQKEYDFYEPALKQLRPVIMLKKRLYLRRFLAIQRLLRLYANQSTNFWTIASRFFIIEPAFYEHDKNHKFDNSKTYKNLFFNGVAFYFI